MSQPHRLITGDRSCVQCGYNLIGQAITQEPHYSLFVVRCPECGKVIPVHEYPAFTRSWRRIGAVVTVIWMLFLLALLPASSGSLTGMCITIAEVGCQGLGQRLDAMHQEYQESLIGKYAPAAANALDNAPSPWDLRDFGEPTAREITVVPNVPAGTRQVMLGDGRMANVPESVVVLDFNGWWATQDQAQLLADLGGAASAISRIAIFPFVVHLLLAYVIGAIWTILLINMRPLVAARVGVGIILLGALFVWIATINWRDASVVWYGGQAARLILAPLVTWISIIAALPAMIAGFLTGRSIARLFVRLLLAPRLRMGLAFLWTLDGKAPPRPIADQARGASSATAPAR